MYLSYLQWRYAGYEHLAITGSGYLNKEDIEATIKVRWGGGNSGSRRYSVKLGPREGYALVDRFPNKSNSPLSFSVDVSCEDANKEPENPLEEIKQPDVLDELLEQHVVARLAEVIKSQEEAIKGVYDGYERARKKEVEEERALQAHLAYIGSAEYKLVQAKKKAELAKRRAELAKRRADEQRRRNEAAARERERQLAKEAAHRKRWAELRVVTRGDDCYFADAKGRNLLAGKTPWNVRSRFNSCDISSEGLNNNNLIMGSVRTTDSIYGSGYPEAHFFNRFTGKHKFTLLDRSRGQWSGRGQGPDRAMAIRIEVNRILLDEHWKRISRRCPTGYVGGIGSRRTIGVYDYTGNKIDQLKDESIEECRRMIRLEVHPHYRSK